MSLPIDTIICGDCREILPSLDEDSIDAIVCDPPYELGFMGRKWDATGIAYDKDMWFGCLRVLKPGGHLLAFGGTRTYHRMACAIEDAGFEIRDMIEWVYGSGFPKSLDISKALDKMVGAEREVIGIREEFAARADKKQHSNNCTINGFKHPEDRGKITSPSTDAAKQWAGFGSALKPAHEPIVLARKPLEEKTIAENVLRWGVGGLNIDACRIQMSAGDQKGQFGPHREEFLEVECAKNGIYNEGWKRQEANQSTGRFPANFIHDNSPAVLAEFAKGGQTTRADKRLCKIQRTPRNDGSGTIYGKDTNLDPQPCYGDTGSPARFFQSCPFQEEDIPAFAYYAKAGPSERNGSTHPTMKPLSLMRYLRKLVTPPGGLILDPFGGSGTTGLAAIQEGFHYVLIEQQSEYCDIARKRIAAIPRRLEEWA